MVCVGTMIGAGYASGQEIAAFFGRSPSVIVPVVVGGLMFAFTAVLLTIGRKLGSTDITEVHSVMFGRLRAAVDGVTVLNALIVLSAMTAGMDAAGKELTGFALPFGAFSCIAGILVLRRGNRGLLAANVAVVPFIIVVISLTCVFSPLSAGPFVWSSLPLCLTYVSMNLLLSAGVLVRQTGMTKKQIFAASGLSSMLIAGMMLLICCALPAAPSPELPLLSLARGTQATYTLFALCLVVSIFTTLLSALSTLQSWAAAKGDGTLGMLVSSVVAMLISSFGFRRVVDCCYPVIGAVGLLYLTRAALFLSPLEHFFRERRKRVHSAGKNAQRDRSSHDEVGLKHLPAVNDEISESRAGYKVFAHDRADPRQSDVDLRYGKESGKRGGQDGIAQKLKSVRAHRAEQEQFVGGGGA